MNAGLSAPLPPAEASPESMARYYAARAAEYERVYAKPERQAELARLAAWLPERFAGRRVLEVAAGTGWWTERAARDATFWLATDLTRETLAVARAKPAMPRSVRWAVADAYTLAELGPRRDGAAPAAPRFDAAFVGFWWSHVPRARLAGWLDVLVSQLAPGARVIMLDNRYVEGSSTPIARTDEAGDDWQRRRLADGSAHWVLKNHPDHAEVESVLGARAAAVAWPDDDLGLTHFWACEWQVAGGPAAAGRGERGEAAA